MSGKLVHSMTVHEEFRTLRVDKGELLNPNSYTPITSVSSQEREIHTLSFPFIIDELLEVMNFNRLLLELNYHLELVVGIFCS